MKRALLLTRPDVIISTPKFIGAVPPLLIRSCKLILCLCEMGEGFDYHSPESGVWPRKQYIRGVEICAGVRIEGSLGTVETKGGWNQTKYLANDYEEREGRKGRTKRMTGPNTYLNDATFCAQCSCVQEIVLITQKALTLKRRFKSPPNTFTDVETVRACRIHSDIGTGTHADLTQLRPSFQCVRFVAAAYDSDVIYDRSYSYFSLLTPSSVFGRDRRRVHRGPGSRM
ncbi:hypothetical protein EVAR_90344_1 [Eumeta japonica]|uniref:Uncharacterized protein n=1 Tax=Eumeta variegata TaxID=151549 RepID=A0A4C1YLF8_EUMVA|nr:hypothetical protein EVAR_90344_1 [Eumeta japonica]